MSVWMRSVGALGVGGCRRVIAASVLGGSGGFYRSVRKGLAACQRRNVRTLPEVVFLANPFSLQGLSVLSAACRKAGNISVGLQDGDCSAALG